MLYLTAYFITGLLQEWLQAILSSVGMQSALQRLLRLYENN